MHAIDSAHQERSAPHRCDCEETTARWRVVDAELSEVIGQRGTAAVLRSALLMTRRTHGWLPAPSADAGFDACMRALTSALADQRPEDCGSGRLALETTFHDLLSALVGAELTGQLLPSSCDVHATEKTPVP